MAHLQSDNDNKQQDIPLATSRQNMQAQILDALEQAVIVTDINGRVAYWNGAAERLYGWPSAEVIGRNILDVTPTRMSQAQAAEILAHLQRGEKWSGEFFVQRRDGTQFWAHVTDSPMYDTDGRLTGMVGVSVDITEHKRIEAQLHEQTETIVTINRIGQLLSAELDLQKLVQLVTDAATELTNAQFGALFYNSITEQGDPYQLYTLSGVPPAAFANFPMPRNTHVFGPTFRNEGVIRSANIRKDPRYGHNPPYHGMPAGHLPVTSYLAVPVVSRLGEVLGGLFFGHSEEGVFTERAEQVAVGIAAQTAIAMDNARLYEAAQQAIRARDAFLSMAAHELKTPVTSIVGYAQMLQRRMDQDEVVTERIVRSVNTLAAQTHKLHHLVDSLFDLSRIQLGQLTLDRAPVDVPELVQNLIETLQPTLTQHVLSYVGPSSSETLRIEADAVRLEQALLNLVENAIKYSPNGGTIEVAVEQREAALCIRVSDQGLGIPAGALSHLFRRFFRADNVQETSISGMGMGLFIVKEIITLHDGSIEVESREGHGSTFRVLLPCGQGVSHA